MCNPPNGFFAASPSTRCAACLYTRIAFPMSVPLTFIIDITLTKYGVVVNNGYGNLCGILEKIYSIPAPFQTNFSVSVICCQSSREGVFFEKKTAGAMQSSCCFSLQPRVIIRCRGSWGWWRSPFPDRRRWGYCRSCRRRCTCHRPPCQSSRYPSGRKRWSWPRRFRGT